MAIWPLLRLVLGATMESRSQEIVNVSPIGEETTTEYPRVDTESSPFERPQNGLLSHLKESEDFAEFVGKLSKSTWFCEVAEA